MEMDKDLVVEIGKSLFVGELVRLGPIDHEKDAEIESRWTHDPQYLRMLSPSPALPLSPAQLRKKYEKIEKEQEESKNLFYFTIRTNEAGRLAGFARLYWVEWTHGHGRLQLGIGDPQDRGRGYGSETLRLLLRFAFGELNLYRLSVEIPEYNLPALRLFQRAGFREEVRRRQALNRDGCFWDLLILGLLRDEWQLTG
jgi:RimJ/RimL family protein N-acetyltransferase